MTFTASRFFPVFSAAFAVLYVVTMEMNWPLFTYHPRLVQFGWGLEPSRQGPAMFWYGWLASSAIGAAVLGALAHFVPDNIVQKIWPGWIWLIPLIALVLSAVLMWPFFVR